MLAVPCKALKSLLLLMPCMTALAIDFQGARLLSARENPYTRYLCGSGFPEPSLFEASKDRSVFFLQGELFLDCARARVSGSACR